MIQSTQECRRHLPVICHVIHAMGVGGAEVLVDQLVRRTSDRYRSVVAVLDDVGEIGLQLAADGYPVEHLYRQPGIDRRCARRLNAFADHEGVQLFHAHQYTPFFQSMLSRGFTGRRPVLFTEHGRHFPDIPSRKRSVVNRLLLSRRDRLVGVGGAVRQALIDNEGLPEARVEVVYNGVNLESLASPARDARQRIRSEFGFGTDDFVAVQVARLHELKDHATAVRTMQELRGIVPQAKLLIVGDGELRCDIETQVRDAGLDGHVVLAGTRSDIADCLAAADVFLMTSISEGIPLTIIESMAAGLPVVATNVGGIPEMISHEETGLLAEAGDANGLAESLVRIFREPSIKESIVNSAMLVARERFSLESMLDQYSRMYEEMLHG